ncbi:hypothetical protein ACHHRT_01515 [Desulfurivibrio sp. D14AmB]|uniref:hypothetical protein n=1 Tax=Desulfurivibrio sp. D14AmB TaxID=3374370 RepID=UPI00376EE839
MTGYKPLQIRAKLVALGITGADIGRTLNVSRQAVCEVIYGKKKTTESEKPSHLRSKYRWTICGLQIWIKKHPAPRPKREKGRKNDRKKGGTEIVSEGGGLFNLFHFDTVGQKFTPTTKR